MYEIVLVDGRKQIVSEDHINTVIQKRKVRYGSKNVVEYQRRDLSTKELLKYKLTSKRKTTPKHPKGREVNFWIPSCNAVEFSNKQLLLDPYTLGLILGDGSIDKSTGYARLHSHKDDLPIYQAGIPYELGCIYTDKRNTNVLSQGVLGIGKILKFYGLNVHGNYKFIPEEYMYGSIHQRLALLKGLMDTDGTCYTNGGISFSSNSIKLAEGVRDIVRSLGGIAKISNIKNSFRVAIKINRGVFNLPRKRDRQQFKSVTKVGIESIQLVSTVPSQCIAIDNDSKTFIVDDYYVTHNTTLNEYLILYLAVYGSIPNFGKVPLGMYVSDSIENGVKNMRRNLEYRWENSDFLKQYVPSTRFTDIRWEFTNIDGNITVFKGYGASSGVRGAKEMGQRPYLALLDDLVSDDDARSPTVIASIEDTIYKAIDYALHPTRRKTIISGTPFNSRDPLYKIVESGAWTVNVFPVCEEFPCSKENFKGAWEDRFDYDYVNAQYTKAVKAGKVATFNQELMLRIMSAEDRLISDSDIVWFNRSNVIKNKSLFNFYITTDFATSEKTSADYSVISVWAYNTNGDWLLVDGVCKRQFMDKNIDDLFRLAQIYKPQQVGIEVSGQQGGFTSWIQNEMITRNNYFTLASENNNAKAGIRPNTNKMVRFNLVVPWFKTHKIMFPSEMKDTPFIQELLNELKLISPNAMKAKHDDIIDTISMLASLSPWKPNTESTVKDYDSSGIWGIEEDDEESTSMDSYVV